MNDDTTGKGLSDAELAAEQGIALPDKEVVSILDLNADLALALDAAAPIDLGVAANANVAAPIDAAVGANVLSTGSTAQALADQGALVNQGIHADATANAVQDSGLEQGASPDGAVAADPTDPAGTDAGGAVPSLPADPTDPAGTDAAGGAVPSLPADGTVPSTGDVGSTVGSAADGSLLNVDVNLNGDANIAAPINGAVAANANVAAPIDASVAANVGSVDSNAVSIAQQTAVINQDITGDATANSDQTSDITQP
ncbi:peptidoglycan-binding protein [Nocardioides ungokensis]|uniref:peptidoglycan-binding protein n=1 Tax=Nocardioides ungokensis TaxID=1643322 RepID=UPI0015DF8D0B|nr:peptidoglycan-binding protein [Nocardioides ungokensis]